VKDMSKLFFGTLISHAKNELRNIDHLLIRVDRNFLLERSIDQVIEHLRKTQEHLIEAKKQYQDSMGPSKSSTALSSSSLSNISSSSS
jgi:prefoldin subunit 5